MDNKHTGSTFDSWVNEEGLISDIGKKQIDALNNGIYRATRNIGRNLARAVLHDGPIEEHQCQQLIQELPKLIAKMQKDLLEAMHTIKMEAIQPDANPKSDTDESIGGLDMSDLGGGEYMAIYGDSKHICFDHQLFPEVDEHMGLNRKAARWLVVKLIELIPKMEGPE